MTARARALLAAASALHALEPDDLRGHAERAEERLAELTAAGFLDAAVVDALSGLLEQRAPEVLRGELRPAARTLSPERHRSSARRRSTLSAADDRSATGTLLLDAAPVRHQAAPRLDPDDLSGLTADAREAIAGTAFARILIRSGDLEPGELPGLRAQARETGARVEDLLVADGRIGPLSAMNVFAEVQVARPTCLRCLLPLESGSTCSPATAPATETADAPADDPTARAVLAAATALHVLEPSDLRGHHDRTSTRLEELSADGLLDDLILSALEMLLERKAPATLSGDPRRMTLSPEAPRPSSGNGTLSPARSDHHGPPTARFKLNGVKQRHEAAPRLDPDDLDALPPAPKSALAGAAFARLLMRNGALTAEELSPLRARARAEEARLEDVLVAEGFADPITAMELFAEAQITRPTCLRCLQPLASSSTCAPEASEPAPAERPVRLRSGTLAGPADGPVPDAAPRPGGRLGDYELLERIGEGGMGIVFRAHDRGLNREVALKIMRAGPLASPMRRQRFLQEAEAAAALHHRNIVPIHQIGEIQGYPYYTMDHVDGTTIDRYVKERGTTPEEVASLVRQVADGVHHFHTRGIIHRDLKPDNVLVNAQGVPQIIDFGIAKKVTGEDRQSWTVEGDLMGTPHYMSPEQAAGRNQEVDTRSDVYAVGTILYELLSGEPPFHGLPQRRVIQAIQDQEPQSLRRHQAVDSDLRAIVEMAMAKEPDRRYGSAFELTQDLERYVGNEPIRARPATLRYRARKFVRRHRRGVALTAFLTTLVLGAAGYLLELQRARRAHVDALLASASNAPLEERPDLYSRVLGLVPDHEVARLQRQAAERELDQRRSAAEQRRLDAERVKRERAQVRVQQLERERQLAKARAEVEAIEARQRARTEARKQARRAAERRSERLLKQAREERNRLKQIGLLDQAILLVSEFKSPLRRRVAQAKLHVVIELARGAITTEKVGLAEYWLHQSSALDPDADDRKALAEIRASVVDLRSGRQLHETARRFIRKQDWLSARAKLLQARARGFNPALIRQDLALVDRRCRRTTRQLLTESRGLLREGRPLPALERVRRALRYATAGDATLAMRLQKECADAAAHAAQLRCLTALEQPGRLTAALAALDRDARRLSGTAAGRRLAREFAHRTRLTKERARASLLYVPALRGRAPFVIQRREVTNAEFAAFVRAGGYRDATLFDAAAQALRSTFVDQTGKPGPRTWRDGGFGDVRNGSRPVRGVTWYEARAFAQWRSRETGRRWRLPTRREWEQAAGWDPRAGRLRAYPWGATYAPRLTQPVANQPLPVGSLPFDRSPLGLLDAGGSVCEWVTEPSGARPTPRLKGSRYAADAREGEHAARVRASGRPGPTPPIELTEWIGFRLVREVTP